MDETAAIAGTTAKASVQFNPDYFKSQAGVLKLLEFALGLISWALIASVGPCEASEGHRSAYQFIMFVTVTSWIMTIISILLFSFGITSGAGAALPWTIIEFCFNAFWALMYFVASSVQAAYTCRYNGSLIAASIFAYFTTTAYVTHANISFREWKGRYPWQEESEGSEVTT